MCMNFAGLLQFLGTDIDDAGAGHTLTLTGNDLLGRPWPGMTFLHREWCNCIKKISEHKDVHEFSSDREMELHSRVNGLKLGGGGGNKFVLLYEQLLAWYYSNLPITGAPPLKRCPRSFNMGTQYCPEGLLLI